MDSKAVYKYCKQLGCCEACCLRYIGIKNPSVYENVASFVIKYKDGEDAGSIDCINNKVDISESGDIQLVNSNSVIDTDKNVSNSDSAEMNSPPCKKKRLNVCVSCLGVLQEENWIESYSMVKEVLLRKRYECGTFACALSAPIATLLRERAVTLKLAKQFPGYDIKVLTALKEAWKWSFGLKLAAEINKTLDSGAVSPLLITLSYDYADDLQELEILKQVSPQLFEERSKQKRRFVTEFTRRSVEQALERASLAALEGAGGVLPHSSVRAVCVSAACAHAPMYLAGRYVKLSRNLPQSPWILDGKRVLPSSVQEIIYKPLAQLYNLEAEEADGRFKMIAAGREDVDVRCLGDGRPFAIEIADPTRQLTPEELARACEEISNSGEVVVKQIVPIVREDLAQLKKGEETKSKTYEALCIKLSHSKYDIVSADTPVSVTPEDIARINCYRNTPKDPKLTENRPQSITVENEEHTKHVSNISDEHNDTQNIVDKKTTNIESNNVDDDKNISMDTSKDVLDKTNRLESDNIADKNKTISKETSIDYLDTLNVTQKAANVDDAKDMKPDIAEPNKSIKEREASNGNITKNSESIAGKLNGVQKFEILDSSKDAQNTVADVLDNSRDTSGDLDTSDEVKSDGQDNVRITIQQKTPIRVLHRRPLLTRTRQILDLKAEAVPGQPQLFRISVRTSAGTYVKEWAHGELRRSRPALADVLAARVDLLALDVTAVHLHWPPT